MKRFMILMLSAGLFSLVSCQKNTAELPAAPVQDNTLTANASFQWKTYKTIAVAVTGIPTTGKVTGKFSIELENGQKVYEAMHDMQENYSFNLYLPAHASKLIYKYGTTFTKEVTVTGTSVALNYVVPTDNGYIP